MIVNVVMLAFQPEVQIYPIDVPLTVQQADLLIQYTLKGGDDQVIHQLLDLVFYIGNQDDRPHGRLFCSVSAGDVALFADGMWLCSRMGWRKITVEQMAEYCAMDRMDRQFCDLMKWE